MGIQREVAKWITHEYDPCLPMVHVEMNATESANSVSGDISGVIAFKTS